MTAEELADIGRRLTALAEYFDKPLSQAQSEIYLSGLADVPHEALVRALDQVVRTRTGSMAHRMPKVAELRELVTGRLEDRAQLAWVELQRLVSRHGWVKHTQVEDPALQRAMEATFGSWQRCCEQLAIEGPAATVQYQRFQAAYQAMARREEGALPAGPTVRLLES